jgi:phosphoribosylcarboxyaminoimidazole (NCAIR) mutase
VLGAAADIGAFEGALAPPPVVGVPAASGWLLAWLSGLLAWLGVPRLRRIGRD